ncbi:MAG: hypothetical protein AAGA54_17945 [Myxococcota bacterium]
MSLAAYFQPMLRTRARAAIVLGLVSALLGVALQWLPQRSQTDQWIALACTALFVGLGLLIIGLGLRDGYRNPTLRTLEARARDVVWVYAEHHASSGAAHLVVCTRTGAQLNLPCARGKASEALALVGAQVPHAVLGFDAAVERRFFEDPTKLGRPA